MQQLICIMYAGFKSIEQEMDIGVDLGEEWSMTGEAGEGGERPLSGTSRELDRDARAQQKAAVHRCHHGGGRLQGDEEVSLAEGPPPTS